ncbi:MAG: toll/interleukin-1 receptor domain-containing protein, partial [Isosphaerales bacterium]
ILGMDDWRHRILGGLRESRLLLVCLSPAYLESEYCAWEFNEYLNHEIARALLGEGVAPVYFVDVPGWEDRDFEARCAEWVKELRRRQHVDLRPWFRDGEKALRDAAVRDRMDQLNRQIHDRLNRINIGAVRHPAGSRVPPGGRPARGRRAGAARQLSARPDLSRRRRPRGRAGNREPAGPVPAGRRGGGRLPRPGRR